MCQKAVNRRGYVLLNANFPEIQKSAHGFSSAHEERGIARMQRRAETGKDGQKRNKAFYCLAAKGIPEQGPGALRTGEDHSAYKGGRWLFLPNTTTVGADYEP